MLEKFIKTYSGTYTRTAMVRHKGVVIAFAMDKGRKIWYTILDLNGNIPEAGTTSKFLDVENWSINPTELIFPREIAEVGFGVAGQTVLPLFKKNSDLPEPEGTIVKAGEENTYDYFRSTTARFTADVPFQVLSDGRYVYIFRQAITRDGDSMVHVDEDENILVNKNGEKGHTRLNKDTNQNEWVTVSGAATTPLADSTLLVDRFVLVGTQLTPKMEVRYQRSRSKARPASRKDSLGPKDLDGNVFYEPTQELKFVGNLTGGHFSVLLVPTAIAEVQRWQIFAENSITGRMDSYNVERSEDGLFNTRGSQTYTCADHPQVYTRKAGTCPECGKTLTLRLIDKGFSESAMKFDGVDDFVKLVDGVKLEASFTQEVWLLPSPDIDDKFHGFLGSQPEDKANCHRPPSVWVYQKGKIHAGFGDGVYWNSLITKDDVLMPGKWNHVAVTFDGKEYQVYVNGEKKEYDVSVHKYDPPEPVDETGFAGKTPCGTPIQFIGKVDNYFQGVIDEVRIWKRARARQEIVEDMHHRLTGLEPDLVGYWRFDEGYGNTIHDQSNNKLDGTSYYDEDKKTYKGIKWTQSDAPVGEHPGIERTSFEIKGRRFTSAPTSLLYYQQSKAASGYSGEAKPLKNTGRVMLTVATNDGSAENAGKNHLAALDFGVSASGRLAQIPDEVNLSLINAEGSTDQSLNDQLDRLAGLQTELVLLNGDISRLEDSIACLQPIIDKLDHALKDPLSVMADITNADYTFLNPKLNKLKETHRDLTVRKDARETLDTQLTKSEMYAYEHANYQGRRIGPYKLGSYINIDELNNNNFNDLISSIVLDGTLQVVAYQDANRRGASCVFSKSVSYVGNDWNDKISSMDVQVNPAFTSQRDEANRAESAAQSAFVQAKIAVETDLNDLNDRLIPLRQEKNAKETRKATVEHDLLLIWNRAKNGSAATMPRVHTDPLGLTISGGLLGFAWTDEAPFLFDSATGKLVLYFRGRDDQFFVAYYDTFTERAQIILPSDQGKDVVSCFSMSTAYDKVAVEIKGSDVEFCEVILVHQDADGKDLIKETWANVPREAEGFAKVLNGQATGHTYIGSGRITKDGELTLLSPVVAQLPINSGATLMIGDERIKLNRPVHTEDTTIHFTGEITSTGVLPIYYVEYDYRENAICHGVAADLWNGSVLIRAVPLNDPDARVKNSPKSNPYTLWPNTVCQWTAAAPGSTVSLDGRKQYLEISNPDKLHDFDAVGDLTLEAWVKPTHVESKARVIQHNSANSNYMLALEKNELMSALGFNGAGDHIDLGEEVIVSASFTQEAWILPTATDEGYHGFLGNEPGPLPATRPPSLWTCQKRRIHAGFGDGVYWNSLVTKDDVLIPGRWNHVAVTFDGKEYQVYVNGEKKEYDVSVHKYDPPEPVGETTFADKIPCGTPIKYIGRVDNHFQGAIDEVRIWKRARTQSEIQADMNRRLSGSETDLAGYWHFEDNQAKDYSRYQNHGRILGKPSLYASPIPAYKVVVGVGEKIVQACEAIPVGNWTHLAAAFDQAYGLEFNDGNYLDCGNDTTLDISQDLTIEAFLQITALNLYQFIIRRGVFGDGEAGQHVPYSLSLNASNQLEFSFEDVNRGVHSYLSGVLTEGFHKVAVTRARKTEQTSTGAQQNPSVKVTARDEIRFYTDGVESGSYTYGSTQPDTDTFRQPVDIGNNNKPVLIGENYNGIITEVRVWNFPRAVADIAKELTGTEKGLVSWWRFQEGKGDKAFDSKSQNHATIRGAQWVKSPDPQGSRLSLFINGSDQKSRLSQADSSRWAGTTERFCLGALAGKDEISQYFQGELEEVRIWQSTRTEEQIQDNLFRRIPGEKEDLIAYYTFDAETSDQISDYSLRGNHLKLINAATHVLSTAPIGEDTPQVRSALAGIRTPFSGKIGSTPAIQEYGDMQVDSQGNLIGAFKRCYSFILDGKWQIITGYKVGDMVTEWIGQVQFKPELIGFIEGAPPVPSENLTSKSVEQIGDEDDYNQASMIELVEAQETTYTYGSSRDTGFDMSVEFNLGFGPSMEIYGGLGVETKAFDLDNAYGLKSSFEHSLGWLQDASTTVSQATGKSTSLELRGHFSRENGGSTSTLQRRFVPENIGLALVKSETADVFALRLRHNGALISYQMRPNPDIPKDWNLIHFPINPRYTKQGTLDGKVGLSPDGDYLTALTYSSNSSYFKPIEAYALKGRIHREELQLRNYFEQYAAETIGRRQAACHFSERDLAAGRMLEKLPNLHKRNLINTYVWTADGGLFAETQETLDSQQEMIGGSYAFIGKAGPYVDFSAAGPGAGMEFGLDALFGGHLNLTVTKTRESRSSYQMNINLDKVERDIYLRDENSAIALDTSDLKHPKPLKHPGKVDAYRFMSFYLEPLSDHFDDFFNLVVDPIWLEQSDDPGAAALRGAWEENQEKKPAPWRVLHRVTYISRVLPPLDLSAPPSLEKTLQTLDIDSNYELIKQMDPHVRDHLTDFAEFTNAVEAAIETYLPELRPHKTEVKEYLSLYYGLEEGYPPELQGEWLGEDTKSRQAPNKPPAVKVGQYPEILLLTGQSMTWKPNLSKTVIRDDRLIKTEDLFLTWEFLPLDGQKLEDVAFDDPHKLETAVTFRKKGHYKLRLAASDGILSASDETIIVINEAPVIESITPGTPERISAAGGLCWRVDLSCRIQTGLGKPSEYAGLTKEWKILSGSQSAKFGAIESVPDQDNEGMLEAKTTATFYQSGNYLLEFIVNNGIETSRQINLEIAARVTDGLCALYTFEVGEGATVHDVSGSESPLDLVASNAGSVTQANGHMVIQPPAILSALVCRLTRMIKASNAITIEAWITPPKDIKLESNPSLRRILTLSNGPSERNFILAQRGNAYHAGLRTTDGSITDVNASLKSLEADVIDPGLKSLEADAIDQSPTHVVFTRDAKGNAELYKNGEPVVSRTISGDFSHWDDAFQLVLGNEFKSNGGYERAWSGEYHLLAIYNCALRPEEVKQNFEFGADRNLPPKVFPGDDREINWSLEGCTKTNEEGKLIVQLQGRVIHDRPPKETIEWKQISGPLGVTFANVSNLTTEAYFPRSGSYKLRLKASDGELVASREVTVNITHEVPIVKINIADPKLLVTGDGINVVTLLDAGTTLVLGGTIQNSQLKDYPAGKLKVAWSCDGVLIANSLDAAVTFKRNGVYGLKLTATNIDDESLTASDSLTITVNRTPIVDAGPDQVIILPGEAILDATISDDGLPVPPGILELTWTGESENSPGEVVFENPNADYTTVRFTDKGIYTLKLTAFDGAATSEDKVTVIVNKAPVVVAGEGATVKYKVSIPLMGVITDDGFGNEDQRKTIKILWEKESGPEEPTFKNAEALETTITFLKKGVYVLKVTANNGYDSRSDTVTFTVNEPPRISFGGKRSFSKNNTIELVGVIDDDGLGDPEEDMGKIGVRWEQTKGPTATIDNKTILNPKVKILQGKPGTGTYEFTLTVTNPSFSPSGTSATIEIKVD